MNLFYPTISMLYHDKAAMQQSADKISRLGERRILLAMETGEKQRQMVKSVEKFRQGKYNGRINRCSQQMLKCRQ